VDLGSGKFQVVGSHTYAEEGNYHLSVSITAADSSTASTNGALATVADAALSAGQLTPPSATAGVSTVPVSAPTQSSPAPTQSSPVTSSTPSNTQFLDKVYHDLLGRAIDSAGLSWWTGRFSSGATRQQIVSEIENSAEYHQVEVSKFYEQLLHRPADEAGLRFHIGVLENGGTFEEVAALIAGSQEYFMNRGGGTNAGFLKALYQDGLNRALDARGNAVFTAALNRGATPGEVAAVIFGSSEFALNQVESYSQQFLHRPADSTGLEFFTDVLTQGGRDEDAIALMLGSDEYFNRT
jgi:hypothetical protein